MSKHINIESYKNEKFNKIMKKRLSINLEKKALIDWNILAITFILLLLSCIVVYSTSYQTAFLEKFSIVLKDGKLLNFNGNNTVFGTSKLIKHIFVISIGLVAIFIVIKIPNRFIQKLSILYYRITCILVLLVPLIGSTKNGQSRWIDFKLFVIQPSDFYKIGLILYLATKIYNATRFEIKERKFWINLALRVVPFCFLIIYYDLSTGLVLLTIIFSTIILTMKNIKALSVGVFLGGLASVGLLILTVGYRMKRISGWLYLETSEHGFQTLQGLYAISSGGMFGKGIGNSMMKTRVPEANNDFVFTIICEEFGIIGGILIIILFCILLHKIFKLTLRTNNIFYCIILMGCVVHIATQVIINISVTLNLIPNTGIGLPFLSSGGSSILSFLFEIGIILKISKIISLEEIKNRESKSY